MFFRRETRPKILWNTGKKLETARLPEGSVAAPVEVVPVPVVAADPLPTSAVASVVDSSANNSAGTTAAVGNGMYKLSEQLTLEQVRHSALGVNN